MGHTEESQYFELHNSKDNNEIQYQSFQKDDHNDSNEVKELIYINILDFQIFGVEYWNLEFEEILLLFKH